VAQGMVIQSVAQFGPTNAPTMVVADPVMLKAIVGVFTETTKKSI